MKSYILSLVVILSITQLAYSQTIIFEDNFESYLTGSHPASNWITRFSGQSAAISEDVAVSAIKSFKLVSQPNFARVEVHELSEIPDCIVYEGWVYLNQPDKGYDIGFGQTILPNMYFPRNFVAFQNGGKIAFFGAVGVELQSWTVQTWYKVKVLCNFSSLKAKVWIDDVLKAEDIALLPKSSFDKEFALSGSNFSGSGTSTAYFDDIKLYVPAPVIKVVPVITLWPPDHTHEIFNIEDCVVSVEHACEGSIPINDVVITSVTSDEAEDAQGNGDGKTTDDIVIASDCKSVQLRKERQGEGNGRVYTIHLAVQDNSGNVGTASCVVTVPHNQAPNGSAVDDGPVYTVQSNCTNSLLKTVLNRNQQLPLDYIESTIPVDYGLEQNYPNPFNPETEIRFRLPEASQVVLKVYNILGEEIRTLSNSPYTAGTHKVRWDGKDNSGNSVSSGVYLYRITAGDFMQTKKMSLVR
ncbi:T9SS type A sorting domain-containing protein [candidate division KSB1 bacterium]|nr:T9SS type A sorting domain-containing protein [candidate division KSB1 bacterium]NIV68553.1 T9SS type A sorting domain-containing protein [Phycisphaerae bacterium]NIR69108.1 T9SS type A sorting domain-containing protein [candidate division KSB1 bacterium]NIS22639.1 T9SS type A sorting domain-containing protein [candidate division KSB1 bacterium]NIT69497.1 T9SS type A sorting domain-containing protein [candidate division KSB1 bacterium]